MAVQETTELVEVMIDGIATKVPKGTLVIEAARRVGVMIPHFCYHPKLAPDANCRMCLVEIEKMPKLQTSCSTPVAEGMVVRSSAPNVEEARQSVLELILANHPLDCPVCDQGGRCDLQDFSHQYTRTRSPFHELKRVFPKRYFGPLIETQMNRCVTCMRCVRYCDEVMDVKALAASQRGTLTEIVSFSGHELDCEYCGGCVQICPVGALVSRLSMYEFRPWMLKRAETICGYCGDGCHITLQTKDDELIEVNSTYGAGRNNGDLCPRGYFGFHASEHPDRLKSPMLRRDGQWVEVPWEEALETVRKNSCGSKVRMVPMRLGDHYLSLYQRRSLPVPKVHAIRNRHQSTRQQCTVWTVEWSSGSATSSRNPSLDGDVRRHRGSGRDRAGWDEYHGNEPDYRASGQGSCEAAWCPVNHARSLYAGGGDQEQYHASCFAPSSH